MSMSNGELRLEGREAVLSVKIPDYEVQRLDDPESAVLAAFALRVDGVEVERTEAACVANQSEALYECTSRYELPEETSVVEVACDLPDAIVANHVHVLRAVSPEGAEQQVFDYASRTHTFRFRPMGTLERWSSEAWAGAVRVLLGPAQLLFLFAVVVASRSRNELLRMAAAFVVTLAATATMVSILGWQPPPGFLDAAGALTIAYLAVETLTLPDAGGRWLVAGGMGAFHGLYFGVFLQQAPMLSSAVLSGAVIACLLILSLLHGGFTQLAASIGEITFRKSCAVGLGVIGASWFVIRLI